MEYCKIEFHDDFVYADGLAVLFCEFMKQNND